MKKKSFLIIVISLSLIIIIFSYLPFKAVQVTHFSSDQIEQYLSYILDDEAYLETFLNFKWDTLYILGPYLPNDYKHNAVGSVWYTNHSYINYLADKATYNGEILSDGFQELIFLYNGKVVSTAIIQRSLGDFLALENRIFNPSSARFKIQLNEYNYRQIVNIE